MSSANNHMRFFFAVFMVVLAFILGQKTAKNCVITSVKHKVDTLIVRDTITREMPVYLTKTQVMVEYVPVRDTLRLRDTLFVPIPIEKRVYEDSLYRAEVSGYKPSLDKIDIYQQIRTIKEVETIFVEERKRWGLGIQAGYGVGIHSGVVYTTPYIGVGVSFNFLRW